MFDILPITSEKPYNCGATCMKMLLAYYGMDVPLDELERECNTGIAGCTGADLLRAGRKYGLDMQAYSMDADELVRQDRPAVCNWKYGHWILFDGRDEDGWVYVCNPDMGRYRMPEGLFKTYFTGLDDHPGQGVAVFAGKPFALGAAGFVEKGAIFEHEGAYWRALVAIARGEEIVEGVNAAAVDVVQLLNDLEKTEEKE